MRAAWLWVALALGLCLGACTRLVDADRFLGDEEDAGADGATPADDDASNGNGEVGVWDEAIWDEARWD